MNYTDAQKKEILNISEELNKNLANILDQVANLQEKINIQGNSIKELTKRNQIKRDRLASRDSVNYSVSRRRNNSEQDRNDKELKPRTQRKSLK